MLNALRTVILPPIEDARPLSAGYEAIGAEEDGPVERNKGDEGGVYWCFWVLGAGVLLSWNVLICTIPLFANFFPLESGTRMSLASWLSTAYCFSNLFFLGAAQRGVGKTPPSPRLHSALLLLLIVCLLTTFPVLPFLLPHLASTTPNFLLPLLIILTLLLALSTAYLQSAVFALASLWGSPEVIGVMSGQGGIAVLVSGTQIILAIISTVRPTGIDDGVEQGGQSTLASVGLWALCAAGAFGCMIAHRRLVSHPNYSIVLAPVFARRDHVDMAGEGREAGMGVTKRVLRKNWMLESAVAWVFIVTLSVFPPITTAIVSVRTPPPRLLQPAVFIPFHFVIFNIGDYLGRTYLIRIPGFLFTSHPRVLLLSLARSAFIPIFLLCNIVPRSSGSPIPAINSDTVYLLILLVFGLTNGYISSLSMILASSPSLNPAIEEEEKDVAGTLAAFCLVAGLAWGSLCSFGVNWLVRGNAFG